MKGLDLAENYYLKYGAPMIQGVFKEYVSRIAVGMVGPGSECFGFDDEISRDHDWGPGFCIWLNGNDYKVFGASLQDEYGKLPRSFDGYGPRLESPGEEGRTGVSEISAFYRSYTGFDHVPQSLKEWLYVREQSLAQCTNGRIFSDPLGEFSRWREALIRFYPEDVRLKKIASRCFTIAQSGQYNFDRSLRRKEYLAVRFAETQFCTDVISLVFLLNRRYTPFYKWMHRAVKELPYMGRQVHEMIAKLIEENNYVKKLEIIELICAFLIEELQKEGLTDARSDFLVDHAHSVHRRIQDRELGERFSLTN